MFPPSPAPRSTQAARRRTFLHSCPPGSATQVMLLRKPHTKTALIFNALRRQYMPSSITCVALPRVVARGRAHPPPCRYVGTYDHRAKPAKVEAAARTTYTEWSVMVEPRQHIVPPHMFQARLVRLPDGCSCVGTAAAPAVRGQGSSPPRLSRWRQMSLSRQPASSPSAGAGHRPPLRCACPA